MTFLRELNVPGGSSPHWTLNNIIMIKVNPTSLFGCDWADVPSMRPSKGFWQQAKLLKNVATIFS